MRAGEALCSFVRRTAAAWGRRSIRREDNSLSYQAPRIEDLGLISKQVFSIGNVLSPGDGSNGDNEGGGTPGGLPSFPSASGGQGDGGVLGALGLIGLLFGLGRARESTGATEETTQTPISKPGE